MKRYVPKEIESKWQKKWEEDGIYRATEDPSKPKRYVLEYFPYPSGAAMHVGHVRNYTIGDVISRHMRMSGYNVLHPMGWDAFGLPAENYAIKNKISPRQTVDQNTQKFRQQLMQMGFSYDWSREIDSTDPKYYKWTQWFFLMLFRRGLAYQKESLQWWCPVDKTVLANEQVENGRCWRCDNLVEKKALKQWFFKITEYADRLEKDLDDVNWSDAIKSMQRNWIGRSKGAEIDFVVDGLHDGEPVTGKPQQGEEFRQSIVALVHNPKTNEVLTIDWGAENGGTLLIGGGIESGEDIIETARREVTEETGYKNLKYIAITDRIHHHYVAHSKGDIKRYIHAWGVHFELENDERVEQKLVKDEVGKFNVSWVPVSEVDGKVKDELHRYVLDTFLLDRPYSGDRITTVKVYTTRPDTLAGATFLVLSPEHPLVGKVTTDAQKSKVEAYVKKAQAKSEIERQDTEREKSGVFTGAYAANPLTKEKIPIWVADYVLYGYGTGAIMAVPAHDERDYEFAQKFELPIVQVIARVFGEKLPDPTDADGVNIVGYDPVVKQFMYLWNKNSNHAWLPGGGRNDGESYEDSARRELKEEAGFSDVKDLMRLGDFFYTYYYNDNKKTNRRAKGYNYLAIIDKNEKTAAQQESYEDFEVRWGDIDTVRKEITSTRGDVSHWLDALDRAEKIAEALDKNVEAKTECYTGEGILINSGSYDDMESSDAREKLVADLALLGIAKERTNFKMRDWLISRQRYWGAPIPIIHCPKDGAVAVPEDQLPVVLPELKSFEPSGDGRSPLANVPEFVNTNCPKCGGPAERETDTMDGFACSSWYFLRFADPHNDIEPFSKEKSEFWLPVDDYIGGAEHAVMHLLYARFWTKVMYDEGLINFQEPFTTLRNHGLIMAPDGTKMSKSKGNTIEPGSLIDQGYGADSIRIMELFIGPWNQTANWSVEGMAGSHRFLQRIWTLVQEHLEAENKETEIGPTPETKELQYALHLATKRVSEDLHELGFNTAISAIMELVNTMYKLKVRMPLGNGYWQTAFEILTMLIAPFTPHIAEELWQQLGSESSVHTGIWPTWSEKVLRSDTMLIVVQVNGKVRANIDVQADATEEDVLKSAKADKIVAKYVSGSDIKKTIYVPKKLVNFVI